MLIQQYIVDFSSNNNFFLVKGVQGDTERYVRLSLSNYGQPYSIGFDDTMYATIRGTKPDNKEVWNYCEIIDDSTIQFKLTAQMLAVAGKSDYEIAILHTNSNKVLTSFPFYIIVSESSINVDYIKSSNEFTVLADRIYESYSATKECIDSTELCVKATNTLNELEVRVSSNEKIRVDTENARKTTETARISAEKDRYDAEEDRVAAENARQTNENARQSEETTRINTENTRTANETSRVSAEQNRVTAENGRVSAENTRVSNENTRKSSETSRANAETSRVTSEQNRVNAEALRVQAENSRQTSMSTAIENAEKATTDAINATDLANEAINNLTYKIGIDDTKEDTLTTWSSSNIKQKIKNALSEAMPVRLVYVVEPNSELTIDNFGYYSTIYTQTDSVGTGIFTKIGTSIVKQCEESVLVCECLSETSVKFTSTLDEGVSIVDLCF